MPISRQRQELFAPAQDREMPGRARYPCGEVIVVAGGGHFDGFQAGLGGGASNDQCKMVGRACRGAQSAHFFDAEFLSVGRVE